MSTPDSLRAQLVREIHKTGCRLDDAAAAADVALRFIKGYREKYVAALLLPQKSIRQAAVLSGFSKSRVHQIASSLAISKWTDEECTLPPAA